MRHNGDTPLDVAILASRSDVLKVAVGFSPRNCAPPAPRRVATFENHPLAHAPLRDAALFIAGQWAEAHGYYHSLAPRGIQDSSFSANSRWHSSTSFSASNRLALASASVSPWEIAAGTSSTKQVYPPSAAGSKTAVSFMVVVSTALAAWQVCEFIPLLEPALSNRS